MVPPTIYTFLLKINNIKKKKKNAATIVKKVPAGQKFKDENMSYIYAIFEIYAMG